MKNLTIFRKEIKFIIPISLAINLKKYLDCLLIRDEHSKKDSYFIRSLYFDSINNDDYNEKLNGNKNRKKIRLRIYDLESKKCKLELKQKNNNNQQKFSLLITKEDALEFRKKI